MAKKPKNPEHWTTQYIASLGKLSGREAKAQKRLQELAAKYEASGMTKEEALARARADMRDNGRQDWRAG